VSPDPALRENQAEVTVTLADGRELSEFVEAATGSPENPMPDEGLRGKVHDLVWPFLPRWKEQRQFELVESLEELPDVGAFAELLEPAEGRGEDEPA